ncbi:MAG: hypothetical protein QM724_03505 [Flavobacteriales bacterium]
MALAFYNRYPLVFSDSGTYIRSAFTLEPPADRPIGYGLIIRAVTWQSTLWTVIIFQSFMLAWLLLETLQKVLPAGVPLQRTHLALVLVLVLCTSMPWYATQIMPDVFTPMIALVLYLLFRAPELGRVKRGFLWICLFFFLITHYANTAMAVLLLAAMAVVKIAGGSRSPWPRFWPNLGGSLAVLAAGMLFVGWYNGRNGMRPVYSPTSHVFLAARLCENGMLGDFLHEHCPERNYALCPYKDELPMVPVQFIWGDSSLVRRIGPQLTVADPLLAPVVHDLLSEPEYLGRFLRSSLVASVTQLFQVSAASCLSPYGEDSAPYRVIAERLPWELSSYVGSMQMAGAWWDLGFCNTVVRIAALLAVVFLAWTRSRWRSHQELALLVPLLLAWVVLNAMITASLANVFDRLQSRVAWLVVLAACLVLLQRPWCIRILRQMPGPA